MNSTDAAAAALAPAAGTVSTYGGDGIRYALGVSVSVLLVIVTITVAFRYCTRAGTGGSSQQAATDVEAAAGLDEATLMSYPKAVYSVGGAASSCSICLSDLKEGEVLRELPECGHSFHLQCVDPWLRSRPTCPLCRTSPLPSPMPTPLAEAIPLARQL
ncbi:RING-H2 finger protein ATL70-like [Zingiber officinale]|uniref:RING-H2 finger protein ATL70-like n=1 Tax=Zingiber officinale TaxID=94328 RepID=UPI001C4D031A|nr:RING-H2 finger protein ATL70-like [Zingiber officinale]